MNKRIFTLAILLTWLINPAFTQSVFSPPKTDGTFIRISGDTHQDYFRPLQEITVSLEDPSGKIQVIDGGGNSYFTATAAKDVHFLAGGALGRQTVRLVDKYGNIKDEAFFYTNVHTAINDNTGKYGNLLKTLYWTMVGENGETEVWRLNNKFYYTFVRWLRDHVHTLKGMKYFYPELKSGIDLYAETQRSDGMIWDNIYPRGDEKNWWNRRFDYGNFIEPVENGKYEMKRIPVENDVEYLFLEGLYYTWQATGDDQWMASHLDQAIKAVHYSTTDPYRWSDKYQLLKRGFTIDTWDFQSNEDAARMDGNDIMRIEPGKTRFGIMYGDNTGMADGCLLLAEMLEHAGRKDDASRIRELGNQLQQRIDQLAWNGNFYTHHIPEDPSVKRDLGVDQSKQVSLSNAYSLNRDITHEQAVDIIKTYQKIRTEMPSTSPGEWYTIFPPFEKGFGDNDESKKWQYMNGGVTPIVAGELAHGAFENGYEKYGVDILDRLIGLASKTGDYLHCTYAGKMPEKPSRNFEPLDLATLVNGVYPSKGAEFEGKTISYKSPEDTSSYSVFHDIPFRILNPEIQKFTAIELSSNKDYPGKISIPVNAKASSLYLLHGTQHTGLVGSVTLRYNDGTGYTDYIDDSKIGFWWDSPVESGPKNPNTLKAWRSNNNFYESAYLYGINNPNPDRTIKSIELESMKTGLVWEVMGLTLSDYPVFFEPSIISWGIPDNWGSAAVVYALIEGLAGIKDNGVAFDKVILAPRWTASDVKTVSATARYEASGGYVSYDYSQSSNELTVTFTGNAGRIDLRLLLPDKMTAGSVTVNDKEIPLVISNMENSNYLNYTASGPGVFKVSVRLK